MSIKRYLREAIEVEGATFIGNAHGYDLFQITTWAAAQQFILHSNRDRQAGAVHFQNTGAFTANIVGNVKAYFFAVEDTNEVVLAVIMGAGSISNLTIISSNAADSHIRVPVNFQTETNSLRADELPAALNTIPLFLLPEYQATNVNEEGSLILNGNNLVALLGCFTPYLDYLSLELVDNIREISPKAFCYGVSVQTIIIPNTVERMSPEALAGVANIKVRASSAKAGWQANWNAGNNNIEYDFGMSPEERERINRERAEREEAELAAQRNAELAAQREAELAAQREAEREAERVRLEREGSIRDLRYKVVGKEITILGLKKKGSQVKIVIPPSIEDKPVTVIAAYAFFSDEIIQVVTFPPTLKRIERYAFAGCNYLLNRRRNYANTIPKNCLIGKGAFQFIDDIDDI